MAEQEKTSTNGDSTQIAAPSGGKLELSKKKDENGRNESGLSLPGKGEMEVSTFSAAGLRPIGASHMDVYGTILNNRPVMASHLKVLEYLPGNRPIFASEIVILDNLSLPGGRPILASDPLLLQGSSLPGGRPIASNEIDDSETLMGFID
jgi:hypothetical protein